MGAHRCGLCGINYPVVPSTLCPIHEEKMDYRQDREPDDDWLERSQDIAKRVIDDLEDGIPIPDLDPDSVFTEDGRTFIYSWDVIKRGVGHRLGEGDLLRADGTTYEVLGYIDSMRAYWVKEFPMHLTDLELKHLANGTKPRKKKKP